MEEHNIKKLRETVTKLRYLETMDNCLYYDRWNACPPAGFQWENQVNGFIYELRDQILQEESLGQIMKELSETKEEQFSSDLDIGVIEYIKRQYQETKKVPLALQQKMSELNANAQKLWEESYGNHSYQQLKPAIKEQFQLKQQLADCLNPNEEPFQVLVNHCDPGYTLDQLDQMMKEVKEKVISLLQGKKESKEEISIFQRDVPQNVMKELVEKTQQILQFKNERSTLFEMHHPVCVCFGPRDSRPSTSYEELIHCILAGIHETGHGFYNYNSSDQVMNAGLWGGVEGAMHESQSRFYENHIGRSLGFWEKLYPELQKQVSYYQKIPLSNFMEELNRVTVGPLRLKADELTNSLHIIIRYELEREYFQGKLNEENLEEAWNDKYQTYLGVTVTDPCEGILQDVHWASGYIGYFQSYLLGDIYASQFRHQMAADCQRPFEELVRTDIGSINLWLKEHIHQYGQTYSANSLLEKATGQKVNTAYYLQYLDEKYGYQSNK